MSTDHARDDAGQWQVDRRLLAAGSGLLGVLILAVWPVDLVPPFLHDDALLHLFSGVAITLALAATIPRRDDAIAATVALIGVLWEPFEWWLFRCYRGIGDCTAVTFREWMTGQDTLADMTLVALGSLVALVLIGRYE